MVFRPMSIAQKSLPTDKCHIRFAGHARSYVNYCHFQFFYPEDGSIMFL